jgi:hypothetical protein
MHWFSDDHCESICVQNKLFYTWLRVAELRNIQAAKRIVAQRRRQKLKLARLLRPQLPLLASWESLDKPHADAVSDLAGVLSAACTSLPVTAGAQVRTYHARSHVATHEILFLSMVPSESSVTCRLAWSRCMRPCSPAWAW